MGFCGVFDEIEGKWTSLVAAAKIVIVENWLLV
jgi:hypothetical protein